jgi:hypothetical protein
MYHPRSWSSTRVPIGLKTAPSWRDCHRPSPPFSTAACRQAGFDDDALRNWHIEFERETPQDHAALLKSLGIRPAEIADIRRCSKEG